MERIKEITIRGVDNGIVVHVGRKVLVYPQDNLKTFIEDLCGYLSDPEGKEIEIGKRRGFDLTREYVPQAFEDEPEEQQPQPDEDEEITEQELDSIDILISAFEREVKYEGRFTIGNNWIRESVIDDLKTIRTLLQSRQPVVTRGEIEQWVTMLIGDYADNKEYFKQCVTMTVNLFKSKGVDVRGEK